MISFKTDSAIWVDNSNLKGKNDVKIGTMTYHYNRNGTKDFGIYTYDPLYYKFIEKIKNVFAELHYVYRTEIKLNTDNEDITDHEIIYDAEFGTICSTLNKISGHKVHVNNLDSKFFKCVNPDDDVGTYDYEKLLIIPNDEYPTVRNLNEKSLINYKIIPDEKIIEILREYIDKIRNHKSISEITLLCNDKYDQLKSKHIKASIIEMYDNEVTNDRVKFINAINDLKVVNFEKRYKSVKVYFSLSNIVLTVKHTEDNNDIIGRTLISMSDEKEKMLEISDLERDDEEKTLDISNRMADIIHNNSDMYDCHKVTKKDFRKSFGVFLDILLCFDYAKD